MKGTLKIHRLDKYHKNLSLLCFWQAFHVDQLSIYLEYKRRNYHATTEIS